MFFSFQDSGEISTTQILLLGYSIALFVILLSSGQTQEERKEQSFLCLSYPFIAFSLYTDHILYAFGCYGLVETAHLFFKSQFKIKKFHFITYIIKISLLGLLSFKLWPHTNILQNPNLDEYGLVLLILLTSFQFGIFPFHISSLVSLNKKSFGTIAFQLNPLLPSLLLKSMHTVPLLVAPYQTQIFCLFFVAGCYLVLVSFYETHAHRFLQYISYSLGLFWLMGVVFMHQDMSIGWSLYYMGLIIALSGACVSLSGYTHRYGTELTKLGGIHHLNPTLSWGLLGCFFILSNMPLTLTFLGEDIILFEIFKTSHLLAVMSILLAGLNAISLYRFFARYFLGETQEKLPSLKSLPREKWALLTAFLSIACGFLLI
jgi:hypothetical protein